MQRIISLLVVSCCLFSRGFLFGQEKRIVQIQQAGSFGKDEANFKGANILTKRGDVRVKLFHQGALIEYDK